MPLLTLNDDRVISATVYMPLVGPWSFRAHVDSTTFSPGQAVRLVGPGLDLRGTALPGEGGVDRDALRVHAVAGKGKLRQLRDPKPYRGADVRTVLTDIARESGEVLSPTIAPSVLDRRLPMWMRHRESGALQLEVLLDALKLTHRYLDDGSIWVGQNTWPSVDFPHVVIERREAESQVVIAADEATLRPGVTFLGRKVVHVTHSFTGERFRTEVEFGVGDSALDRVRALFESWVRMATRRLPYLARYAGRIAETNPFGRVGVLTDSPDVANQEDMPLRLGLPGFDVRVPPGTRCTMGFDDGDPARPVVTAFDAACPVDEIVFDGGTKPIARVDDDAAAGALSWAFASASGVGTWTLSYTAPGAAPVVLCALSAPGLTCTPATGSGALAAKITSGNPKFKA